MSEINLEECERVAIEVAKLAGKMIADTCGKVSSIESKQSYADLVTETDKNVELLVFEQLKKKFPSHQFIGEESVAADNYGKVNLSDEPTWIVDPVDGKYQRSNVLGHILPIIITTNLAVKKIAGTVYLEISQTDFETSRNSLMYANIGYRVSSIDYRGAVSD